MHPDDGDTPVQSGMSAAQAMTLEQAIEYALGAETV